MSMALCKLCERTIDTDNHLESDGDGNPICNDCYDNDDK